MIYNLKHVMMHQGGHEGGQTPEDCTHDCSTCGSDCPSREGGIPKAVLNENSSIKKVIGIVSGKGGVGKSMVTALSALAATRNGTSPVLRSRRCSAFTQRRTGASSASCLR